MTAQTLPAPEPVFKRRPARRKMLHRYRAFSLEIESELPLPELVASSGAPDVVIRLGRIPEPAAGAATERCVSATEDEVVLFWEKGGSFRMRRGAEMVVQPAEGVTEEVLRTGILGPGLATLLQQLGFLVLHGSAVVIAGKAVAFVGWKGQGKSTLAAALFARGITLLTDDLLALSTTDGSQVLAEPGFPQFKLWPDSVESSLGESPESLPRLTSHFDKRVRKLESGFALARVPLAAIYVLTDGPELRVQRFSPQETFQQLVTNTFCARYGRQVFQGRVRAAHFQNVARTAGKVPVFRLERPRALAGLGSLSDFVVGHATGL